MSDLTFPVLVALGIGLPAAFSMVCVLVLVKPCVGFSSKLSTPPPEFYE